MTMMISMTFMMEDVSVEDQGQTDQEFNVNNNSQIKQPVQKTCRISKLANRDISNKIDR